MTSHEPLILPARASDLAAVSRMAEVVFSVPWPRSELKLELSRPHATLRVLRARPDAPVLAFINYWRLGDELQIMNLATEPGARRHGYARALLDDALRDGRASELSAVSLEVRVSNRAAIALYSGAGFVSIGVRPRYYSDNAEDALVMRLALTAAG